jgi:dihydropyrimidinase/dihydroorotase
VNIIAEANPQHLFVSSSDDPPGDWGKLTPPIRDRETAAKLVEAVRDGRIQCMGTDHVPSLPEDNVGPGFITEDMKVYRGAGGIGMQTLLPAMLSEGVNRGRLSLERVVEVCCKNPAWAGGLYPKKGALVPGSDGDIAVVDLKLKKTVTPETIKSPFNAFFRGRELTGWPVLTVLRGNVVMEDGEIVGKPGGGQYLARKLGSQLYPMES